MMDSEWRLLNNKELYRIDDDLKQEKNLINKYPEVAKRLSASYEKWWQSILAEKADERYAYIKVGTEHENPSRISAHDLSTSNLGLCL